MRRFSVAALTLLILSGCGSSEPHRIKDEDLSLQREGQTFDNLLVIGVYDDRPYRVSSETTLAEELKSQGISASPSYDLLPDLHALQSDEALQRQVSGANYDGLLVVATLDEGYDYDIGDYYETRGIIYLLGGRPGAGTDMGAFLAWAGSGLYELYVALWDVETMQPVWQISTNSSTTGSESGDTSALAELVASQLREKGLI